MDQSSHTAVTPSTRLLALIVLSLSSLLTALLLVVNLKVQGHTQAARIEEPGQDSRGMRTADETHPPGGKNSLRKTRTSSTAPAVSTGDAREGPESVPAAPLKQWKVPTEKREGETGTLIELLFYLQKASPSNWLLLCKDPYLYIYDYSHNDKFNKWLDAGGTLGEPDLKTMPPEIVSVKLNDSREEAEARVGKPSESSHIWGRFTFQGERSLLKEIKSVLSR